MRKPAQNDSPDDSGKEDRTESLEERRRRLGERLASHKTDGKTEGADGAGQTSYAKALQLSTEFVAGILVGGLLGYLMDHFLGTTPWGMIVFLLLGFVAGVLNVLRSAGLVAENRLDTSRDNDDTQGR